MVSLVLVIFQPTLVSCSTVYYGETAPQQGRVTFQLFYDDLSPYGQWIDYGPYGYVWIPDAGPDFFPYLTNGYWVWTDFGWTWMSEYSWGWAPFHYGRWDFDDLYGWFWVPDEIWGPCWVTWRRTDGYYGWAPMRPGISIDASFRGEDSDVNRWCFVTDRDFDRHDLTHYYANRGDNDRLLRSSTVITNTYADPSRNVTYVTGPSRDAVRRVTGRRITTVTIRDNDRPGERLNGSELQIYRPRVERATTSTERPAPHKITDLNDLRKARENNSAYEGVPVQPGEINRRQSEVNGRPAAVEPQQRAIERENSRPVNREPAVVEPQRREIDNPVQKDNQENRINRNEQQNREVPATINNRRQDNTQRYSKPPARDRRAERENRRNNHDR